MVWHIPAGNYVLEIMGFDTGQIWAVGDSNICGAQENPVGLHRGLTDQCPQSKWMPMDIGS